MFVVNDKQKRYLALQSFPVAQLQPSSKFSAVQLLSMNNQFSIHCVTAVMHFTTE